MAKRKNDKQRKQPKGKKKKNLTQADPVAEQITSPGRKQRN